MHLEMVKKNHIFVLVFKFENVIEELPSFPVFLNVFCYIVPAYFLCWWGEHGASGKSSVEEKQILPLESSDNRILCTPSTNKNKVAFLAVGIVYFYSWLEYLTKSHFNLISEKKFLIKEYF